MLFASLVVHVSLKTPSSIQAIAAEKCQFRLLEIRWAGRDLNSQLSLFVFFWGYAGSVDAVCFELWYWASNVLPRF